MEFWNQISVLRLFSVVTCCDRSTWKNPNLNFLSFHVMLILFITIALAQVIICWFLIRFEMKSRPHFPHWNVQTWWNPSAQVMFLLLSFECFFRFLASLGFEHQLQKFSFVWSRSWPAHSFSTTKSLHQLLVSSTTKCCQIFVASREKSRQEFLDSAATSETSPFSHQGSERCIRLACSNKQLLARAKS